MSFLPNCRINKNPYFLGNRFIKLLSCVRNDIFFSKHDSAFHTTGTNLTHRHTITKRCSDPQGFNNTRHDMTNRTTSE